MSEYKVTLKWERGGAEFSYQKYPRDHTWSFDGGHTMTATAAPAYLGNPANVDPEEAFVASLSSCHMLTFLAIACKYKFVVDEYTDDAVGHMEKNAEGRLAITRVELHPKLKFYHTGFAFFSVISCVSRTNFSVRGFRRGKSVAAIVRRFWSRRRSMSAP